MAAMQVQQQVQQPGAGVQQPRSRQQTSRRGGDGGDGGGRDDGQGLPDPPEGEDLHAFLIFVHDLLAYWNQRVQLRADEFGKLDEADLEQLSAGWADFENQWGVASNQVKESLSKLDPNELKQRGLVGSAYRMKRHFVKKWRDKLAQAYRVGAQHLQIRPLWRRLFTAADVVLDSVERSLNFVPGPGAIVSGLKEFKETAMGVTGDANTD